MTSEIQRTMTNVLAELSATAAKVDYDAVMRLVDLIAASPRVFAAGAGRSGLLIRCMAMRLMHMGRKAYVVGESITPGITRGDLLLLVSGSGETESLIVMAEKSRKLGARVGIVTANPVSSLARVSDVSVLIPSPSPKIAGGGEGASIQPMGNLFEQSALLLLDSMVVQLMKRDGITSDSMFKRHANLE